MVGFAAETEDLIAHAEKKRAAKGCDWIVANDVSPGTGTFGGDANTVHVIDANGVEDWPSLSKREVAERLDRADRRGAQSMIRKVETGFPKRSCSTKMLERHRFNLKRLRSKETKQ